VLPNRTTRWILFVVLSLPALVSMKLSWMAKPFAVDMKSLLAGSARASRVEGTGLVTQLLIAFAPQKPERCKLKFIVEIESENRKGIGVVDWMFFQGFNWVMDRIMQSIRPWMAGELVF